MFAVLVTHNVLRFDVLRKTSWALRRTLHLLHLDLRK